MATTEQVDQQIDVNAENIISTITESSDVNAEHTELSDISNLLFNFPFDLPAYSYYKLSDLYKSILLEQNISNFSHVIQLEIQLTIQKILSYCESHPEFDNTKILRCTCDNPDRRRPLSNMCKCGKRLPMSYLDPLSDEMRPLFNTLEQNWQLGYSTIQSEYVSQLANINAPSTSRTVPPAYTDMNPCPLKSYSPMVEPSDEIIRQTLHARASRPSIFAAANEPVECNAFADSFGGSDYMEAHTEEFLSPERTEYVTKDRTLEQYIAERDFMIPQHVMRTELSSSVQLDNL